MQDRIGGRDEKRRNRENACPGDGDIEKLT
jgi:hypothetical protein